jgi:hypothetical protein
MLQLLHREGKRIESIQIIDITGRTVSAPALSGNSISVASLPAGTYFLQAVVEGQTITSRFIKE